MVLPFGRCQSSSISTPSWVPVQFPAIHARVEISGAAAPAPKLIPPAKSNSTAAIVIFDLVTLGSSAEQFRGSDVNGLEEMRQGKKLATDEHGSDKPGPIS